MTQLILDHVFDHEASQPERIFLTQPLGGGRVADYSWAQVLDQSRRMATHLQARGFPRGARIAILSKNCAHFFMAELAIWLAGYTTVAIFPTETAETVGYVLGHSEASLLFVGKLDTWPQQEVGVPAALPRIAFPLAPQTAFETWDAIVARTAPLPGRPQRAEDELAMIIYTSGSTGRPKGAMVGFGAISRAAEGIVNDLRRRFGAQDGRILSYLPLAHSFERSWVEAASLVDGRTHVFFAETLNTFLQDLQRARPTMFISVPRLWLKFQQGVFTKMPPARLDRLLGIPIVGRIVAKKVLKGLGLDQVLQAGSGSAPLPAELIRWYRKLGLKLFEGYGMTEDNSYSFSSSESASEPGYVGKALPGVQARISPERRDPDQVAGAVQRLLQAARTDGRVLHRGRLLPHRRPRRAARRRPAEDHRPHQGAVQDRQGQVRRARADRKQAAGAPDAGTGDGQRRRPAGRLCAGGAGRGSPTPRRRCGRARRRRATARGAAAAGESQLPDHERLQMIVIAREPWASRTAASRRR